MGQEVVKELGRVYVDTTEKNDHQLIIKSRNYPERGAIMLRSKEEGVNEQGFLTVINKVGLFKGNVEDLERIIERTDLKRGDDFEKVMPVKIVIKEQKEPFFEGQAFKIYPTQSRHAGEPVLSGGDLVYRASFVVSENSPQKDETLITDTLPSSAPSRSAEQVPEPAREIQSSFNREGEGTRAYSQMEDLIERTRKGSEESGEYPQEDDGTAL